MRKLLDEISGHFRMFLEQRENVALIVWCHSADAVPLLKIIEGVEGERVSDLFWTSTDNFVDRRSYVSSVFRTFSMRHETVRLALAKKGMRSWPHIPDQIASEDLDPAERFRALVAFSRELFPIHNAGNAIWTLMPLEVADPTAFAQLMKDVLRHDFPFPWCHHIRFIIREDPASNLLRATLTQSPRILWYAPDLTVDAINRSLEAEIADESLPLSERMAPVPVMAGNDLALGRYAEALKKYELLLNYNARINNYPMAALALNGIGEVYDRTGDLALANEAYETALIPASQGEHPPLPILLNIITNLANLRLRQRNWPDAEAYYDMAQQLATAARSPSAKLQALEMRGYCQQQQGKNENAVESWRSGAVIAAQLEDVSSCRAFLDRLEQLFTALGQSAVASVLRQQIAALN